MLPNYLLSMIIPFVFLPFVVFVAVQSAQQGGLPILLLYFLLFLLAHLGVAAAGIGLMRERWRHLALVPIYRVVYEPLRAYLLYTSIYRAVRGMGASWNKLARTGELDQELAVSEPQPELLAASRSVA